VLPWVGLALVGVALGAGAPLARVRVVAAELILAGVASGHVWLGGRATTRRARRQRAGGLPWGIRLRQPIWLRLYEPALGLACGGLLAAAPGALGLPAFSIGVFLTVAAIGFAFPLFSDVLTPSGLTFAEDGLRVHFRRFDFRVAWTDIVHLEAIGPDHFTMLMLHLEEPARILASVQPSTPAARRRAEMVMGKQGGRTSLMLMPWTGGVDGVALMQAIEGGRSGRPGAAALN